MSKGIRRLCKHVVTPASLGYSVSVFNKTSTLKETHNKNSIKSYLIQEYLEIVGKQDLFSKSH